MRNEFTIGIAFQSLLVTMRINRQMSVTCPTGAQPMVRPATFDTLVHALLAPAICDFQLTTCFQIVTKANSVALRISRIVSLQFHRADGLRFGRRLLQLCRPLNRMPIGRTSSARTARTTRVRWCSATSCQRQQKHLNPRVVAQSCHEAVATISDEYPSVSARTDPTLYLFAASPIANAAQSRCQR